MKIAFLFLIYDTIFHEDLWHAFFNQADTDKYSIFIHFKTQAPLKHFERYKLPSCLPTKYGHVSLIHAENLLFKTALADPLNYKFVLLSQACIPIKAFDHVYTFLTSDTLGHISLFSKDPTSTKHHQWIILNRELAETVSSDTSNQLISKYNSIFAPEEYYYLACIRQNTMSDQVILHTAVTDYTTFVNWGDTTYKFNSSTRNGCLKTYNTIFSSELQYLINSNCLFARKFNSRNINFKLLYELFKIRSKP